MGLRNILESSLKSHLTPYPPKEGLRNSMIFRCSPLGLGVKHLKIIEFYTFRSAFILVIILLLICIAGSAQPRRFKQLTSADGISQSEVYSFLKDSRGFIWIGTVDGLNRYDGYNIEIFNTNKNDPNSLSNNTVRSLAEDQMGRIWIGTDDGLNMYDSKTELIYQVKINTAEKRFQVWSIYIQDGYLLVGTANGLWRANIQTTDLNEIGSGFQQFTNFSYNKNTDKYIWAIVKCKLGGYWIVSSNNISRIIFQQNSNDPVIIEDFSINPNQRSATEDSTGNLWIATTQDGLLRYNPYNRETRVFNASGTSFGPSSRKCSSLAVDKDGNLWVGTGDRGLNFIKSEDLNKNTIQFETIQNKPLDASSLNSNLIYSLYVSNDNLLWVGTIGAGVNIFNPEQKKFTHYKYREPNQDLSNSNFIRAVYVDSENKIWTGTHGNGLFIYDRAIDKFRKLGFETQSVFYISQFNGDKKFICCGSGIYLVKLVNNELKILSQIEGDAFFYIEKSKADVYWVATLNGLIRMKVIDDKIIKDEIYNENTTPRISTNNCRVLFYNQSNNTLYLGTEGGGLNAVSLDDNHYPKKIKVYQKNNEHNSLSNNYIRSIIKDSTQNIWIGTYEGLNKMIPDSISGDFSFKTYTKTDGLPNNMIQFIAEDGNQNLWIGTNGGLSQFIRDEERFINYTVHDGIQSNEFSEHTVFNKTDGEIIMGGINGINAFYPNQINVSSIKPKTTITGFYLFNEKVNTLEKNGKKVPLKTSITLTDSVVLLPKQKNIGFEFSAMIYPNAEKIRYAYMLEGFDGDWQFTDGGSRIANYTNLRHGKYTFKVKSTNTDGIWEDTPREIFVHIQTPFVYTWFAYLLYFLVGVLIFIYFSHFTIIRYTTKKKLLLEKNHNEKVHELDVLRTKFFINISHDLRTPLTLIREPLDVLLHNKKLSADVTEKLELIKRNVKRLNYLIEQLLDVRKAESGKLTAKLNKEDIVEFTNEEIAHFTFAVKQKGLELNVISKPGKIAACFDRAMMSKIYFNIISNAIKFTDKGKIEIHIEKVEKDKHDILKNAEFGSFVKIEVRDTGKGISKEQYQKIFDRFYQGKTQSGNGYGIGLSHTKELIDAHKGYIIAESIEEAGTTIRFFIPDIEIYNENEITNATSTEDIYMNGDSVKADSAGQVKDLAKTILVVEDNVDMRSFIKSELKKEYNVLEAADGLEGLKKAIELMPDLIVCDVMMPNMDGIELCEKIKSNIETSHIPFILLTAKVDLETKYEGIETGADDYIPKPFEMAYLYLRIKNLLESRERLRKLFQKSPVLEPSAVTVTSVDEKFLSSLMKAVDEGISESDFSINSLESKMAMSHAKFYRKITSLTGQSGQELLQNMRMKRAHQILSEKKGLRVSEVAYMVGFTNPKYFSKCFRETFGFAPSDLL
jgi:signal transduction histidine kinase/ligand-binding sensor domain-containing protein/DNA-binding response OmpR family regulator